MGVLRVSKIGNECLLTVLDVIEEKNTSGMGIWPIQAEKKVCFKIS